MSLAPPIPGPAAPPETTVRTRPPVQQAAPRAVTLWGAALGLSVLAAAVLASLTLVEPRAGDVHRLFYLHVPAALNTFVACGAVFVASLAYLWNRGSFWDAMALASAKIALLLCSAVLITGMFWAKDAWGRWWVWSPRLTFSFVLWLLYAGYMVVRLTVASPQRRAVVSAVYGIIAFLDVPLVYVCVKLLPDIHPEAVQERAQTAWLLLAWIGAVLALAVSMIGLSLVVRRPNEELPR